MTRRRRVVFVVRDQAGLRDAIDQRVEVERHARPLERVSRESLVRGVLTSWLRLLNSRPPTE